MNLYRLTQSRNNGWYTYDSAIVAAESSEEARTILPSPFYFYDDAFYYMYKNQEPKVENIDPSWCHPRYVKVQDLGKTELDRGLILASFNAGFDESRYLDMRRIGQKISSGTMDEVSGRRALETLEALEIQTHDRGLAELRYHMVEANRAHDAKRTQEYELKVRDYMGETHEDWS